MHDGERYIVLENFKICGTQVRLVFRFKYSSTDFYTNNNCELTTLNCLYKLSKVSTLVFNNSKCIQVELSLSLSLQMIPRSTIKSFLQPNQITQTKKNGYSCYRMQKEQE